MFPYTVKFFFRNFWSNKSINTLNLIGMAVGLASCMLILTFLSHEFSYDSFQSNKDRLVRITTDLNVGGGQELHLPTTSYPVAEGLAREIDAIEGYVRFRFQGSERPFYVGDKVFMESHICWADSTLFEVFDYPLVTGDPKKALATKDAVVISESTARKFFGTADPIGQEIKLDQKRKHVVTAVMKDIPQPSHVHSHPMIFPMHTLTIGGPDYWVGRPNYGSYLLLKEGVTAESIQETVDKVYFENAKELLEMVGGECTVTLQPISDIHFDNSFDFTFDYQPAISMRKITIFAVLGGFILVIAVLSFINLVTARSSERARQVGISKAIGATRAELMRQFQFESIFTALAAFLLALLLVQLLLPFFGDFTGRMLSINYIEHWPLTVGFLVLSIFAGFVAGIYPSFFLTRFKPSETIKGKFSAGRTRSRTRSVLIVFQFVITIALLLSTMTVVRQLRYMDERDPGFNREQLLVLRTGPDMTREDCELLRTEMLKNPGILAGSLSGHLPTMGYMEYTYEVPEPVATENLMTRRFSVDNHYLETLGIELISGRNFHPELENEENKVALINETAAKALGYEDPIGKILDANPARGDDNYLPITIVGVFKDINFESLHSEILPMLLAPSSRKPSRMVFRLHPAQIKESIASIEDFWKENFVGAPFDYQFLDENFNKQYATEIRLGKLFGFFTVLAILLSCNGLFALIVFSAERRTKEIGVRKVLGADLSNLLYLLTRGYLALVLVANLIAWPVAGFAMQRWLETFAYRAPFAWWMYPLAALLALALAILTVSSHTWRACQVNPANILRQE